MASIEKKPEENLAQAHAHFEEKEYEKALEFCTKATDHELKLRAEKENYRVNPDPFMLRMKICEASFKQAKEYEKNYLEVILKDFELLEDRSTGGVRNAFRDNSELMLCQGINTWANVQLGICNDAEKKAAAAGFDSNKLVVLEVADVDLLNGALLAEATKEQVKKALLNAAEVGRFALFGALYKTGKVTPDLLEEATIVAADHSQAALFCQMLEFAPKKSPEDYVERILSRCKKVSPEIAEALQDFNKAENKSGSELLYEITEKILESLIEKKGNLARGKLIESIAKITSGIKLNEIKIHGFPFMEYAAASGWHKFNRTKGKGASPVKKALKDERDYLKESIEFYVKKGPIKKYKDQKEKIYTLLKQSGIAVELEGGKKIVSQTQNGEQRRIEKKEVEQIILAGMEEKSESKKAEGASYESIVFEHLKAHIDLVGLAIECNNARNFLAAIEASEKAIKYFKSSEGYSILYLSQALRMHLQGCHEYAAQQLKQNAKKSVAPYLDNIINDFDELAQLAGQENIGEIDIEFYRTSKTWALKVKKEIANSQREQKEPPAAEPIPKPAEKNPAENAAADVAKAESKKQLDPIIPKKSPERLTVLKLLLKNSQERRSYAREVESANKRVTDLKKLFREPESFYPSDPLEQKQAVEKTKGSMRNVFVQLKAHGKIQRVEIEELLREAEQERNREQPQQQQQVLSLPDENKSEKPPVKPQASNLDYQGFYKNEGLPCLSLFYFSPVPPVVKGSNEQKLNPKAQTFVPSEGNSQTKPPAVLKK